jgi:hypothetical protein
MRNDQMEFKRHNGEAGGRELMGDFRLPDGKPGATLIQRFDGSALLLGPKGEKIEFDLGTTLKEVQAKAREYGWEIAVEHLHWLLTPFGSSLQTLASGQETSP